MEQRHTEEGWSTLVDHDDETVMMQAWKKPMGVRLPSVCPLDL